MESSDKHTIFDRPLMDLLKPSWEKAFYLAIFLIAIATRFWDLGARAMSHDESLHALYSYYLYNGTGYQHNPMMHGPFLFHASALIYFLFGVTDYTARVVPAIFGVVLVFIPLLFKPWLGRVGAALTSVLLLISPAILYHSRYIRNDIYMAVWTMVLIAALFYYLRDRRPGWLIAGAAVLMLSMATKETAYIFGWMGLVYLIMAIVWQKVSERNQIWLLLGGVVGGLILWAAGYVLGHVPIGGEEAATVGDAQRLIGSILVMLGGTILIAGMSGTLVRSRGPNQPGVWEAIRAVPRSIWIIALVVMFVIYSLLFTTFFTNPPGFITGIAGSISYWMAQQNVVRGDQPFYYYFLTLTMYEYLPFLFGTIATVYYLVRRRTGEEEKTEEPGGEAVLRHKTAGDKSVVARPVYNTEALFIAFLVFWNLATLFLYSWAGERMAWLTVHPALSMIVITGKFGGGLIERVNWREAWRRGGVLLAVLLPITLFGILIMLTRRPFQGLSITNLQATGSWLAALLVTLLLVALTVLVVRRVGGRLSLSVAAATLFVFLAAFTVRTAWMFAYIDYDYSTELMTFAHGTPDVTRTMNEIAEISRRTVGDKQIKVAYDGDVSWPLEWYMREYPNRVFYGENPSREQMDVPIVLAGDKDDAAVQPYLADKYVRFKRRLVWWPTYDYRGLTPKRIWDILTTPEKRQQLWDILYWRQYPRSTDDWYYVHNFYMYVRKDVAQQIWDLGALPSESYEMPADIYAQKYVDLPVVRSWGTAGSEAGQFMRPRGIAVGPEGEVYVVDSDNARIQVFSADGSFLRQWGSYCAIDTGAGCVDPDGNGPLVLGDGQFNEPWGITVGGNGRVYVADTWNHRIQVFESDGVFVNKWGKLGQVSTASGGEDLFYGPRDVVVDGQGRLFVSDTGNKRIMVFDGDGAYAAQWGGPGLAPGSFEEPVGLALDSDGDLYVADTWNRRVQFFGPGYNYIREWPIEGWLGTNVTNKPYIDVDSQGRAYVTDPEAYRVYVFDNQGTVVATFGRYGYESDAFTLPTGIAIDPAGYIYVTDPDGQKVLKFEPLP
jgi:uncharacterized protein (TIGR03663 family)